MKLTYFSYSRVHVSTRSDGDDSWGTEATIKVTIGGDEEYVVAEDNGPVAALDNALFTALKRHWPSLKKLRLKDYKVKTLRRRRNNTAALVKVTIVLGNGAEPWTVSETSSNVLKASWKVLADCYHHQIEQIEGARLGAKLTRKG